MVEHSINPMPDPDEQEVLFSRDRDQLCEQLEGLAGEQINSLCARAIELYKKLVDVPPSILSEPMHTRQGKEGITADILVDLFMRGYNDEVNTLLSSVGFTEIQ